MEKFSKKTDGFIKMAERQDREILYVDGIKHYCRICTAIQKTIEIQKEIDAIYPEVEKEIITL